MTEDDIVMKAPVNVTGNDDDETGGDMSSDLITGAAPGEWMPKLVPQPTGTLDTDVEVQHQAAYIENLSETDSWYLGGFYSPNCLIVPGAPGVFKAQSTSASDGSGKKIVPWGEVSAALAHPDLVLNGVTQVATVLTFVRCFRAVLRNATTGALTTAAGLITLWIGSEIIGYILPGMSYATMEFEYAAAATLGNMPTWDNRRESPDDGLTWVRPNSPETRLYVRGDSDNATLAPGERWCIYCRETLQPGMESAGTLRRKLIPYGEDGS